jgi:hypothetical protein
MQKQKRNMSELLFAHMLMLVSSCSQMCYSGGVVIPKFAEQYKSLGIHLVTRMKAHKLQFNWHLLVF